MATKKRVRKMKKIIALWKTILYFGIMLINDTYYRLALKIQPDGTQKIYSNSL